jgi:acetyl esterase/lipase
MSLPRLARSGALAVAALVLAGCSAQATALQQGSSAPSSPASAGVPTPDETPEPAPSGSPSVTTREMTDNILTDFYLPGVAATLRVPATPGPAPLVIDIPGGGWLNSDPTDYRPLAESLTASGISTSLITYSTTADGATFPRPLDEVACAVRWSAFQLNALGYPASQIYLVGHSAGGQLAMEVAVTGDRFGKSCPYPPVAITGVAGVAGVYDLNIPVAPAETFAGGGTPEERAEFSPITAVSDPSTPVPPLRVMLLTGSDDTTVPASQAEQLAEAFKARGIFPTTDVLTLPHNMGFPLALEIAPLIKQWILGDAYVPSPTADPAAPPASPPADPAAVPASASPAPAASAAPPAASPAPAG